MIESSFVENILAIVLSISTLHALLQPKPMPYQMVGNKVTLLTRKPAGDRGYFPVKSIVADDYQILALIGYTELIKQECFMDYYYSAYALSREKYDDKRKTGDGGGSWDGGDAAGCGGIVDIGIDIWKDKTTLIPFIHKVQFGQKSPI
jgi:hypothetical protein